MRKRCRELVNGHKDTHLRTSSKGVETEVGGDGDGDRGRSIAIGHATADYPLLLSLTLPPRSHHRAERAS